MHYQGDPSDMSLRTRQFILLCLCMSFKHNLCSVNESHSITLKHKVITNELPKPISTGFHKKHQTLNNKNFDNNINRQNCSADSHFADYIQQTVNCSCFYVMLMSFDEYFLSNILKKKPRPAAFLNVLRGLQLPRLRKNINNLQSVLITGLKKILITTWDPE